MELDFLSTLPLGAWGLGMVGALGAGFGANAHCALMCGPLAAVATRRRTDTRATLAIFSPASVSPASVSPASVSPASVSPAFVSPWVSGPAAYHLGRLGAYAVVGGAMGSLGAAAAVHLGAGATALSWVMAGGLVATAFGAKLPWALPGRLGGAVRWVGRRTARLGPRARGFLMGAMTPLLPCGLVYGLAATAAGTGAVLAGAALMLAFAITVTPALVLGPAALRVVSARPRLAAVVRRLLPLIAAAVLVWRTVGLSSGAPTCH